MRDPEGSLGVMAPIRTFWLEETPLDARYLRRFQWSDRAALGACPASGRAGHDVKVRIEDGPDGPSVCGKSIMPAQILADPRWPQACACGYIFSADDDWQLLTRKLYRRLSDGAVMTLAEAPVGALWRATWYEKDDPKRCGRDGFSIWCKTPGGDWHIDGRANNCTMPDDWTHRCWVRQGTVGGVLHVDKNGPTCAAGAGSIGTPTWHGFLDHGWLTEHRGVHG